MNYLASLMVFCPQLVDVCASLICPPYAVHVAQPKESYQSIKKYLPVIKYCTGTSVRYGISRYRYDTVCNAGYFTPLIIKTFKVP
jgi:hypothetical protein